MSNRDQLTLANAIIAQKENNMKNEWERKLATAVISAGLRELRSRSPRCRADARQFFDLSPQMLLFCSLAGLRASHVMNLAREASK